MESQPQAVTVLVVEEDQGVCLLTERILAQLGYSCAVCHSGRKAIEVLKAESFALVMVSWDMLETSGAEVTDWLKENRVNQPLLVMTGASAQPVDEEISPFNIVIKPFTPTLLRERVKHALAAFPA